MFYSAITKTDTAVVLRFTIDFVGIFWAGGGVVLVVVGWGREEEQAKNTRNIYQGSLPDKMSYCDIVSHCIMLYHGGLEGVGSIAISLHI